MMQAYMIMDYNNPLSVKYSEMSQESFKCVSDLINIETVQCVTPETMNDDIRWCARKVRSIKEKACLVSHSELWQKQAKQDERFIIMEHDAYLYPNMEDSFRLLFEQYKDVSVWSLGMGMEFYSMSPRVAANCYNNLHRDKDNLYRGTMSYIFYSAEHEDLLWVNRGARYPTILNYNGQEYFEAPITQLFSRSKGNTIDDKNPDRMIDPLIQGNFHYLD
jgi:hypothetical protein